MTNIQDSKKRVVDRIEKTISSLFKFLEQYAENNKSLSGYSMILSSAPDIFKNDKYEWINKLIRLSHDKWTQVPVTNDVKTCNDISPKELRQTVLDFNIIEIIIANEGFKQYIDMFLGNDVNLNTELEKIINGFSDLDIIIMYRFVIILLRLCIKYVHLEKGPIETQEGLYKYREDKFPYIEVDINDLASHFKIKDLNN